MRCNGQLHRKRQADGDAEEDQHDQYCVQLLVRAAADPCARASLQLHFWWVGQEGLNRLGCLVDGSKAVKTSDPLFRSFVRFQVRAQSWQILALRQGAVCSPLTLIADNDTATTVQQAQKHGQDPVRKCGLCVLASTARAGS
jgi:hypothetical protein